MIGNLSENSRFGAIPYLKEKVCKIEKDQHQPIQFSRHIMRQLTLHKTRPITLYLCIHLDQPLKTGRHYHITKLGSSQSQFKNVGVEDSLNHLIKSSVREYIKDIIWELLDREWVKGHDSL